METYVTPDQPVPVPHPVVFLIGPPGTGKTTLGYSHPATLFDFDRGAHRASNRHQTTVQVETWADVLRVTRGLAGGATIDTLERAVALLTTQLLETPANGADGVLYPAGHSRLRARLGAWVADLRARGPLVVLAHAKEERLLDRVRIKADLPAGVRAELLKVADIVGYLSVRNGRRTFDCTPTAEFPDGKTRPEWTPFVVPPLVEATTFMADLIARARASLAQDRRESSAVAAVTDAWRRELAAYTSVDQLNANLARFRALKPERAAYAVVYELYRRAAHRLQVRWDIEGDRFVAGPVPAGFSEPSESSQKSVARGATLQPRRSERAS